MSSKAMICKYARDWLRWNPTTSESELRAVLRRRFLHEATAGELSRGALLGSAEALSHAPEVSGGGCLLVLLLGPLVTTLHRAFRATPIEPEEVEEVLKDLRSEGVWQSGLIPGMDV